MKVQQNIQSFVEEHILGELIAQADEVLWESTLNPVGYKLSSRICLESIRATRAWLRQDIALGQTAWIEALVNFLIMEFGSSMLELLEQTEFTEKQLIAWMRSMIRKTGLQSTQTIDVHQFESILHSQYEKNQTQVRVMTYSLSNMFHQQILVDVLMKAIQNKRYVIWLRKEDAAVLVGIVREDLGPHTLQVIRNRNIKSKSITEWLSLSNENDVLMIVERK